MNIDCRDRTIEFQNTIRTFQSRNTNRPLNNKITNENKNIIRRNQFMSAAKQIGKELSNTCIKLEKLASLAKKRSLFDDKPTEIQELTYIIKQDIDNLNKDISILQQLSKSNNNNQNSKNLQKHSSNVVVTLQTKLATMSKEFKNVLETRNEIIKQQSARKEQFVNEANTNQNTSLVPKLRGRSILMNEAASGSNDTVLNLGDSDKQQYQQKLMLINEQDNSYLRERTDAMQNIEKTIIELGGIFQQLGTMIREQDELIDRIDVNVNSTVENVESAYGELLKYLQSVTSNRWLIIKIFFVLIVFFVLFVIFMG